MRQVKLTRDANKEKKPGKYSAKPCIEPELSRPKKSLCPLDYRDLTHYIVLVHFIYLLNNNLRFRCSG